METGDWLALIGIIVAVFGIIVAVAIGVIQIVKSKSSNDVTINQTSGWFSKTEQKVDWKKNKDEQ